MEYIVSKNDHSLGPDYFTGWKMNVTNYKFRHIPLFFTNQAADTLSKTLTSFGSQKTFRVVYMGPRFTSNYKAFKAYCRSDVFEESFCKQQNEMFGQFFLKYEFKFINEKQKAFPIRPLQYRLFTGMNPTIIKDDLKFDAHFQCGNLDLAISINSFQYDLLIRVDSNTRGHLTWFYFKVTNFNGNQKVKFNIINFQKTGLMYQDGMKPYCFRSSNKKWEQQGSNIQYKPKKFRYNLQNSSNSIVMNCLSFMYQFKEQDQYVYFAYCIPYTYSYMMHRVASFQKENPHFVQIQHNFLSTGGLQIPVLTITNSKEPKDKLCCLVIGRLHPGQTQGSWVLDGFLRFLCSQKGYYLRQKIVFKIIPMVNVDGVVLGNFRTSISGKDLNRVFDQPQNYQEVGFIRQLAKKYNPTIFLDFHGHSGKKNAFMYGPNYTVDHKQYLTTRLLPKFVSKLTTTFRYYSCIFRISKNKINTGRSIMIKEHNVAFSFTIQTSSYAYGPKNNQKLFNRNQYNDVGQSIAEALEKFTKILFILPKRLANNKIQQKTQIPQKKSSQRLAKRQTSISESKQMTQMMSYLFDPKKLQQLLSAQEKGLIQQLINDEEQMDNQNYQIQDEKSDSDCQEGYDYSEKQLNKMFRSEIEDEISVQRIKKRKKNTMISRKKSAQKLDITTQRSSNSKLNQINLFKNQKIQEIRSNRINYKKKSLKINEKQDQKLPLIKRQNSFLPNTYQFQFIDVNRNKVFYNNWRKDMNLFKSFENSKNKKGSLSLNQINLDYNIYYDRQQDYQIQKSKKHPARQKKLTSRLQLQKKQQKIQKKKQKYYSPKNSFEELSAQKILFPLIQKNKSLQLGSVVSEGSFLQQIIDYDQKIQKNYIRKNIKIVHF